MGAAGGVIQNVLSPITSLLDDGSSQKAIDDAKKAQFATTAAIAEQDRKTLLQKDRDQKRIDQKAADSANQGRAGTILTSPLGIVSGAASNNTLLGS